MKTLIVDDDFTSRMFLQKILGIYGEVHIAVNGEEAVEAVRSSLEDQQPYNLICMDIVMPGMGGQEALREIRSIELSKGVTSTKGAKILMTSALDDMRNKISAFSGLCDDYLTKPIEKEKLLNELRRLELIS